MYRGAIPGAPRRDKAARKRKKRAPGLRIAERDGYWHLVGTLRAEGNRERARRSTGLPATPENLAAADAQRIKAEERFLNAVVYRRKPSVETVIAGRDYLRHLKEKRRAALAARGVSPLPPLEAIKPGHRQRNAVAAAVRSFGRRDLSSVTEAEWIGLVERRN